MRQDETVTDMLQQLLLHFNRPQPGFREFERFDGFDVDHRQYGLGLGFLGGFGFRLLICSPYTGSLLDGTDRDGPPG